MKKRKLLATIISLTMTVSMSGCGGCGTTQETLNETTIDTESETTVDSETEPETTIASETESETTIASETELEAKKFGDEMTDKALDKIEEDLETEQEKPEESEKPEKPENTGNNGAGGSKTPTKPTTPPAKPEQPAEQTTPPADDTGGNPDAGYMTDEEFDAQDWSSDPNINMDAGDDPTAQGDSDTNGTIIAY